MILEIIISSKFLEATFWAFLSLMGVTAIEQTVTDYDLFKHIINSTPGYIVSGFAIIWVAARAFKEVSDAWHHHKNNIEKLKQEKQHTIQEENKNKQK